jgi:hypothetical protein
MMVRSRSGFLFSEITGRADMRGAAGVCMPKKGAHGGNMVSPVEERSRRRAA